MKDKLVYGLILLVLCCGLVSAVDNAPPALPMEIWGTATMDGAPASDGLAVTAEIDGVDHAQVSTTSGGNYDIIIAGGDHELTNLSDPTCAIAWGAGNACIPCSTNPADPDYCIDGPTNGKQVKVKVGTDDVMPSLDYVMGAAENLGLISPVGDWDENGCVDMGDFGYFANTYNTICAYLIPEECDYYDLFRDYLIDMADFGTFANYYGEGC